MDPISPKLLEMMSQIALKNTLTYRTIFKCIPDDTVKSPKEYKEFIKGKDLAIYDQKIQDIQGHIV